MNSQLLFQRFVRDWPALADSLGSDWPAIRDEFTRFAAPLRDLPDDSSALRDFTKSAANPVLSNGLTGNSRLASTTAYHDLTPLDPPYTNYVNTLT